MMISAQMKEVVDPLRKAFSMSSQPVLALLGETTGIQDERQTSTSTTISTTITTTTTTTTTTTRPTTTYYPFEGTTIKYVCQ